MRPRRLGLECSMDNMMLLTGWDKRGWNEGSAARNMQYICGSSVLGFGRQTRVYFALFSYFGCLVCEWKMHSTRAVWTSSMGQKLKNMKSGKTRLSLCESINLSHKFLFPILC